MGDPGTLQELLRASRSGGAPFCEAAVNARLISDWEMSRVVAEMFQLPFLPVDICQPDPALWGELGSEAFRESAVVPMHRFGQLLTVAMPGLASAEVLGALAKETGCLLMPVVGTAQTNRRYVEERSQRDPGIPGGNQPAGRPAPPCEDDTAAHPSLEGEGGQMDGRDLEPPSLVDRAGPSKAAADHEASPLELPPPPGLRG